MKNKSHKKFLNCIINPQDLACERNWTIWTLPPRIASFHVQRRGRQFLPATLATLDVAGSFQLDVGLRGGRDDGARLSQWEESTVQASHDPEEPRNGYKNNAGDGEPGGILHLRRGDVYDKDGPAGEDEKEEDGSD